MKHLRLIVLLVIGAALIAAGAAYKSVRDGGKIKEFKEEAPGMVKTADAYRKDPEYVTRLMNEAIPVAEHKGGLFSSVTEDSFFTALFQAMVDKAAADGKPEVARSLRQFANGRNFVEVKYQ